MDAPAPPGPSLHAGVTLVLVLAALAVLLLVAISVFVDLFDDAVQVRLFGLGTSLWLVGIGWGVLADGSARRQAT